MSDDDRQELRDLIDFLGSPRLEVIICSENVTL